MEPLFENFRQNLLARGLHYRPNEVEYLYEAAKVCALKTGLPLAGAGAVMGAGVGGVTVPLVGTIPGWVAGALAGFIGGTTMCVITQAGLKPQLDQLLRDRLK